ncbi:MAG: hypothetical protein ACK4RK_15535 [Gemmataceae bacterium]
MNGTATLSTGFLRLRAGFWRFVAAPASPKPLAVLRVGVCAVLILQALSLAGSVRELYGPLGVVQWSVLEDALAPGVPRLSWVTAALTLWDVGPESAIHAVFLVYVAGLSFLLLGWHTRAAAIVTFLTHLLLKNGALASVYGVDTFAQIMLFYFVWMPVGDAYSLDRLWGRTTGTPAPAHRLSLRVVQLQLCIVYFATGIEKALGIDWWNGMAIWSSVMRSDLCPFDMAWLAGVPWVAMLLGWGTLLLEVGYPIFMWPRWTRPVWGWGIISLHAGIAVFLGLYSFAAIMGVFTFAAFLVPAEPRSAAGEEQKTSAAAGWPGQSGAMPRREAARVSLRSIPATPSASCPRH